MDSSNNSNSSTHPSSVNHHNKPAPVSPFLRYWLLSSTGNSPSSTPDISRSSTPFSTPPHHHSPLPPAPPPTPANPEDHPHPPALPTVGFSNYSSRPTFTSKLGSIQRSNSTSSINTLPKRSQDNAMALSPPSMNRPLTASSLPSTETVVRAQLAKKCQNKGQSSSKSWDFLVHGAFL